MQTLLRVKGNTIDIRLRYMKIAIFTCQNGQILTNSFGLPYAY